MSVKRSVTTPLGSTRGTPPSFRLAPHLSSGGSCAARPRGRSRSRQGRSRFSAAGVVGIPPLATALAAAAASSNSASDRSDSRRRGGQQGSEWLAQAKLIRLLERRGNRSESPRVPARDTRLRGGQAEGPICRTFREAL